jgi:hypothetical protein
MKDPEVQDAVDNLLTLVEEINKINRYLYTQGVTYSVTSKGGHNDPMVLEITYLKQLVNYDLTK